MNVAKRIRKEKNIMKNNIKHKRKYGKKHCRKFSKGKKNLSFFPTEYLFETNIFELLTLFILSC